MHCVIQTIVLRKSLFYLYARRALSAILDLAVSSFLDHPTHCRQWTYPRRYAIKLRIICHLTRRGHLFLQLTPTGPPFFVCVPLLPPRCLPPVLARLFSPPSIHSRSLFLARSHRPRSLRHSFSSLRSGPTVAYLSRAVNLTLITN